MSRTASSLGSPSRCAYCITRCSSKVLGIRSTLWKLNCNLSARLGTAGIYATIVTDPTIRNGSKRHLGNAENASCCYVNCHGQRRPPNALAREGIHDKHIGNRVVDLYN